MTKGVFMVCFGKRGYGFAAYNLAFSIKQNNNNIKTTLLCDKSSIAQLSSNQLESFDTIIDLPDEVKFTNGKFDPAKVKTSVYEYLPYDYNLFLDVDAVCLKDIEPIFDELIEEGGYYFTHVVGEHTIDKGRDFKEMQWAWADDIWNKYKLSETDVLPATNSSFQFIKKCKESKALYKQIRDNMEDPIPLDELRLKWGGTQPDELYLNIALAQKGITGKSKKEYIFFGAGGSKESVKEVQENFVILSIYGGRDFTRLRYREYYDAILNKWHFEKGLPYTTKINYVLADKHVDNKVK